MKKLSFVLLAFLLPIYAFATLSPITGTTIVCLGSTTALSITETGGAWTSDNMSVANIGPSGIVSGLALGTATISYTAGAETVTTVVTVNPYPGAITGFYASCMGLTLALSSSTPGGIWTSSNPSIAAIISPGNVSGISAGTATISYTLAGCSSTAVATINALPSPITGTVTTCVGQSTTLSSATPGGTWSSSNMAIGTINTTTGTFTGIAPGISEITYTIGSGCTTTTYVTVNPLPATIVGALSFCNGSPTTLGSYPTTGTWVSSNPAVLTVNSLSGIVLSLTAGTSVITYTLPTGCYVTRVVTVNSLPEAITGATNVCLGQTTTLSSSTPGGTWTSNNGNAAIHPSTGVVTGVMAGTSIISYTAGTGCYRTIVVLISEPPNPISGVFNPCAGQTTVLNGSPLGGTWSSASTAIATIGVGSGLVNAISAGNTSITYTLPNTCYTTANVSVNPLPDAIAGSPTACVGQSTTLSSSPTGGTWSSSNTAIASINAAGVVTGISGSGIATITYTLSNGCRRTINTTVYALPGVITGPSTICVGSSTSLSSSATGGIWSIGGSTNVTVGATTGILTGVNAGTATVTYTLGTGCITTKSVTIHPIPAPITGGSGLCLGNSLTLATTSTGGMWQSSNPIIATVSASGLVTSTAIGTTTISYVFPTTGCASIIPITVNPIPIGIIGPGSICNLTTATYGGVAGGVWSSSDPTVITIDPITGMATPVSVDTAQIIYTTGTGCSATLTVFVINAPNTIGGPDVVCAGNSINLTNAATGGSWSSGNTAIAMVHPSSGLVTGQGVGTASITYVLSTGCFSTKTVTVNTSAAPITGNLSFCSAVGTTLSCAIPGGTWSSSNASVAVVNTSGFVNGVTAGTAFITYTPTTGCPATTPIAVDAVTPIAGLSTVCAGLSTTLSHSVIGGTWSSSNSSIATVSETTGIVTGIAEGSTTISYVNSCGTYQKTINVINSIAPITGVTAFCDGSYTTLYNATPGGTWSSSDFIAPVSATNGVVIGLAAGTAIISYAVGTCTAATTMVTIHPVVAGITGTTSLCVGLTSTLASAAPGGTWTSNAPEIITVDASTGTITGVAAGSTTISYTLSTGCRAIANAIAYPLPAAITGSLTVCNGLTTQLGNSSSAGIWISGDPAIAGVNISYGLLTGISEGTATITYMTATGCMTTATATVQPAVVGAISGSATVCSGATTTLSHPSSGGTWSSGDPTIATINSTTGIATGITAGTATITYTISAGCFRTITVTVNGPASITGMTTICAGFTANLNCTTTGGTWTSSNPASAVVSATGVVTGIALGTTIISYAVACGVATKTVTILNSAPLITGASSVCQSAATTLYNTVNGGTWTSSNATVASVNTSGIVSGTTDGTATISYSIGSCPVQTKSIVVNPLPSVITGSANVCQGSTTTLSNSTAGGTWASSNIERFTIEPGTGTITGISNGAANATYTLPTGCTRETTITIKSKPIINGTSSICVGGATNLNATYNSVVVGGTWAGSNATIYVYSSGLATAVGVGSALITFTQTSTGCEATYLINGTSLCTGAPDANTATASSNVLCGGANTTLSLSGGTISCGVSCQWQFNTGGGWTNISGGTSSVYTTSVPTTRQFRCSLTCISSGLVTYSSPVTVSVIYSISTHNVIDQLDTTCNSSHFYVSACGASSALNITTHFGDGTSASMPLSLSGVYGADIYHTYSTPGTYTVKQVLYNDTIPTDSVTFSYEYLYCRTLPIKFFKDNNSNCIFDAGDTYYMQPIATEIDSNGIPIDTIVATSGFYKKVYGAPGTVYGFRALTGGAITALCPAGGVIYDTIGVHTNMYAAKYFGVNCSTAGGYDLSVNATSTCGRHTILSTIIVNNSFCAPVSPVVTYTFNPKYNFYSAYPAPTTVSGNTVTWNLSELSITGTTTRTINVHLETPAGFSYWLNPGDTVHSYISVSPTTDDINILNNYWQKVDTVRSSWDPNDIAVVPEGYILPCTQLEYKVRFENMGNDTAHNIHVLDTLSEYLDPGSIAPVIASAPMDITILREGGYTIARFDFPNINLLDSSHHDECQGMVIFNINAYNGIPDGNAVKHRVGIYFDDNPVVMTNEVYNTTGLPNIVGADSVCAGDTIYLANALAGGLWSGSNTTATIADGLLTGVLLGLDTISYTVANSCTSQTRTKEVFTNMAPTAGIITGDSTICAGATTTLNNVASGGNWSEADAAIASVDASGNVTAMTAGNTQLSYTVFNTCGINHAVKSFTVNPLVTPLVTVNTSATGTTCAGTSLTFTAMPVNGGATPSYTWSVNSIATGATSSSFTYTPADGDIVSAMLLSNAICATPNTAYDAFSVPVTTNVLPIVSTAISPIGTLCQGSIASFSATTTNGGTVPAIWWAKNGSVVASGTTYTYTPANGDVIVCGLASSLLCLLSDTVSAAAINMVVDSAYIPAVTINASAGLHIAYGETDTFTAVVTDGGPTVTYQWKINGANIAGATNATFMSSTLNNGDSVTCAATGSGVCAYNSFNSVLVTVTPSGVVDISVGDGLHLSPNPNNGGFSISGTFGTTSGSPVSITVGNTLGQVVYAMETSTENNGKIEKTLQLPNDLANGVYVLTVRADGANKILRFVLDK